MAEKNGCFKKMLIGCGCFSLIGIVLFVVLIIGYRYHSKQQLEREAKILSAENPKPEVEIKMLAAIKELYKGETFPGTGELSSDQRNILFKEKYQNKIVEVTGRINDVGSFLGKKYITVEIALGHLVDVYIPNSANLLEYKKGRILTAVGKWSLLGSGIVIHHHVEELEYLSQRNGDEIKSTGKMPVLH